MHTKKSGNVNISFEILKVFIETKKELRVSLIKSIAGDPRGYRSTATVGVDEQTAADIETKKYHAVLILLPIDEVKKVEMELKEKHG